MRLQSLAAGMVAFGVGLLGVAQAQTQPPQQALQSECIRFDRVFDDVNSKLNRGLPVMIDTVDAGFSVLPSNTLPSVVVQTVMKDSLKQAVQHLASTSENSSIRSWIPTVVRRSEDNSAYELQYSGMRGFPQPDGTMGFATGPFKVRRTCNRHSVINGAAYANDVTDELITSNEDDRRSLVSKYGFPNGRVDKRFILACNLVTPPSGVAGSRYRSCVLVEGFAPTYGVRLTNPATTPATQQTFMSPMTLVRMQRWGAPSASAYQFLTQSTRLVKMQSLFLNGERATDLPSDAEFLAVAVPDQMLQLPASVLPTTFEGGSSGAGSTSSEFIAGAGTAPVAEASTGVQLAPTTVAPVAPVAAPVAPTPAAQPVAPSAPTTIPAAPVSPVVQPLPPIPYQLQPVMPRTSQWTPGVEQRAPLATVGSLADAVNQFLSNELSSTL